MPKGIRPRFTSWSVKDIQHFRQQAYTIASYPELVIKRAPASQPVGRALLVIPRDVGTAPERNLLRRRLKAIIYEHELYKKGYDWLIYVRPSAKQLSFQQLVTLLVRACAI
jgi:ribonuclease P protein component